MIHNKRQILKWFKNLNKDRFPNQNSKFIIIREIKNLIVLTNSSRAISALMRLKKAMTLNNVIFFEVNLIIIYNYYKLHF